MLQQLQSTGEKGNGERRLRRRGVGLSLNLEFENMYASELTLYTIDVL